MVCYELNNMEALDCLWNGDGGALVEHLSNLGYRMESIGDRGDGWDSKLYRVPQQNDRSRHSDLQGDDPVFALIRQVQPGVVSMRCGWCEEETGIEIPYRLVGLENRYIEYPPGSVHLGFVADWRLIQLFERAGFSCRPGTIHDRIINNYDHFVVAAGCDDHDLIIRYMNSDVRQVDCDRCGPELAAEKFLERFTIGLRMGEKLQPRLIAETV